MYLISLFFCFSYRIVGFEFCLEVISWINIFLSEKETSISVFFCILLRVCFLFWLKLLGMIGEQFDEGDEICGAVVSVRAKQDKISIWTKTASNEAAQVQNEAHLFLSVLMFEVLIICG